MSEIKDLKVLIVSTEVTPYAKSGGLGDVVGSLPQELRKFGVDARIVFPKYKSVKTDLLTNLTYLDSYVIQLGWRNQSASVFTIDSDVPTYLIENDYYFNRDAFYGYGDDFERFAFFTKAAIELLNAIEFRPDVIHFNDWQTGLGPVYMKDIYSSFLYYNGIKSLYTIHNLQYQGVFGKEHLGTMDLPDSYFAPDKLEFYGNLSLMKAGIVYADAISTVSRTYAEEIQTSGYGYGMDGVLRSRKDRLYGIVNGIDYEKSNPETDTRLFESFSKYNLTAKRANKHKLQEYLGLPQRDVPMIAIISRLVDQKGFDLISVAMNEIISKDIQLVILGTGDGRYENLFKVMASRAKDKISANICFNEDLAQKIYASADMFLMPSLFEPCGLGQLFAMRYGTVPIVRKTGGLKDTVTDYDPETKTGTGFVFEDYLASGMMWAVNKALDVYYQGREEWDKIVVSDMEADFSWHKSASEYIDLYLMLKDE